MKRVLLIILATGLVLGCGLSTGLGNEDDYDDDYDYDNEYGNEAADDYVNEENYGDEDNSDSNENGANDEVDEPPLPAEERAALQRDFTLPLPLFAADSAWNQSAVHAAVLPQSDQQILVTYRVLLGNIDDLGGYDESYPPWPYMTVNVDDYSIPIYLAGTTTQTVVVCEDDGVLGWPHPKFDIETEGGPITIPSPAGLVRPAGPEDEDSDGHMVLYAPDTFIAYDLFGVTVDGPDSPGDCTGFSGGMLGYHITEIRAADYFDIRGPGLNADGLSSARAAGTPLLAGLILPEDIERGVIAHALAAALPGPRNLAPNPFEPLSSDYFYPASTTETDFFNTNPYALASGQRLRLKQSLVNDDGQPLDEAQLAPITRMFLAALRDYGAYIVDNSGGLTFYAEDGHSAVLHLSDDEVNALIGQPAGTPLPPDMTKWEIVLTALENDLERIPFAVSPGDDEPDPQTAAVAAANFEVVEPAVVP